MLCVYVCLLVPLESTFAGHLAFCVTLVLIKIDDDDDDDDDDNNNNNNNNNNIVDFLGQIIII